MSLNKFTSLQSGIDLKLQIGCESMTSTQITTQTITMPPGGAIDACCVTVSDSFVVTGDEAVIGGVDFVATNAAMADQVLRADGLGGSYWDDVSGGGGGTETLQEGYNVSFQPQIVTSDVVGKLALELKKGGTSDTLLQLKDGSDAINLKLNASGLIEAKTMQLSGADDHIELKDDLAKRWTIKSINANADKFVISDEADAEKIVINQGGEVEIADIRLTNVNINDAYHLPSTAGLAGQLMTYNDISGDAEWTSPAVPEIDMQEVYDQSVSPQITTTTANKRIVFKQGASGLSTVFNVSNPSDDITASMTTSGFKTTGSLELQNDTYVKKWNIANKLGDVLEVSNSSDVAVLSVDQAGLTSVKELSIGDVGAAYKLTTARGTASQVLTYNAATNVGEWQPVGGGGGSQSIQDTYLLSTQPQLETTALGALIVKQGLAQSADILEAKNSSDESVMLVSTAGVDVGSNLYVSSTDFETRGDIPVIPASIAWVNRAEYAGIINFSAADTLLTFVSTVDQRSVESVDYFILGAMDVGSTMTMTVTISTLVGDDLMLGLQMKTGDENVLGSIVGEDPSQFYLLATIASRLSLIYEQGQNTINAVPNITVSAATYKIKCTRDATTQWTLSFEQGATVLTSNIVLSGAQWTSKQAHWLIGDKSNTPSNFTVSVQSVSSVGYNPSGSQQLLTLRQKNSSIVLEDEAEQDIISLSANRSLFSQRIIAPSIDVDEVKTTNIDAEVYRFQGAIPNALQMKSGLWDDTLDLIETTVVGNTVTFINFVQKRSIASKYYFVPNDIGVGGYCQYNVTVNSYDGFTAMGIMFKDPSNVFFGTNVYNSKNVWWAIFDDPGTTGVNLYYVRGVFVGNLNSQVINPAGGQTIRIRVSRIAQSVWTLSYASSTSGFTTESQTFGEELANKFCYCTAGMLRSIPGGSSYTLSDFVYSGWTPAGNPYKLFQTPSNSIQLSDFTGKQIWAANPNAFEINNAIVTESSLSVNRELFGSACNVNGDFYLGVEGGTITGLNLVRMDIGASATFGTLTCPPLTVGNLIHIRQFGTITTGDAPTQLFNVSLYWGDGGVLLATGSGAPSANLVARYWSLDLQIMVMEVNFLNGTIHVRVLGTYSWLNNSGVTESAQMINVGNFVVIPNVATDVVMKGAWSTSAATFSVRVLKTHYNYEGFSI